MLQQGIQPASLQAIYTHLPGSVSYQVLAALLRAAQATVLYGTALQMAIWLSAYYATLRISHKESAIAPSSVFI